MKLFTKALTVSGIVVFAAFAGIGVSHATINWLSEPSGVSPLLSGVNDRGETYGPEGFGDQYDLITARGDNGELGYVRAEHLNGPEFSSPEEAVAWQEENFQEIRVIPLFASDGLTVVGTFTVETHIRTDLGIGHEQFD